MLTRRCCGFLLAVMLVLTAISSITVSAKTVEITVLVRDGVNDLPDPVVHQFEKLNPDVKVKVVKAPWNGIDDKFLMMTASNLPIDVVISMSVAGWPNYVAQGLFRDLTPFLKRDRKELLDKGIPGFILEGLKIGDVAGSIAYSLWSSLVTTYNATQFEEAGLQLPACNWDDTKWTWDAMLAAAKKLVRFNSAGQMTRAGIIFGSSDIEAQGLSLMWGGDVFPADAYKTGILTKVTFDTPANQRAFTAAAELSITHKVKPGAVPTAQSIKMQDGSAAMQLAAGGVIGVDWDDAFDWGMAPYPLTPALDHHVPMPAWVRAAAIPSSSRNPEAAWRFIKFLLTEAYEMGEYEVSGQKYVWNDYRGVTLPVWQQYIVRLSKIKRLANKPSEVAYFLAKGVADYTRIAASNLLVGGGDAIHVPNGILWKYMNRAFAGQMPVGEALKNAQKEADAFLAKNAQLITKVKK